MTDSAKPPMVGAPDPERRTSPIFDQIEDEFDLMDLDLETGVCYFNDESFEIGSYVCSGDELLQCQERGVWVRKGTCRDL